MIVVVGIGADGMAGLAAASSAELRRATVIYGSRRQLDLLDDTVKAERRQWPSPMLGTLETLRDIDGDVHVRRQRRPDAARRRRPADPVVRRGTGHGAAARVLGDAGVRAARLGGAGHRGDQPDDRGTAHGGAPRWTGGRALPRRRQAPPRWPGCSPTRGRGDSELTVLEQLGGPAERRRDATAREWAANPPDDVDDLNVVAVRYLPDDSRLSVLPDDAFAHDGQITKQSMRAVTLAALAPRPGELLWDVGAGSGSIAIEWCRSGSRCRAVAFERDEQRRKRIAENALAHGAVVDVRGEARGIRRRRAEDGVDGVPASAIFIGGGLTQPGLLDACYERLPARRSAGRQRRHRRVRSRSRAVVFPRRR